MKPYKTIEHTADIGIEVEGSSLAGLFANAAAGLMDLVVERPRGKLTSRVDEESVKNVSITAGSREELLVKWLEEVLYFFEIKKLVSIDFKMQEVTGNELSASIATVKFSSDIHRPKYQIKAVTYHNLSITEKDGIFRAIIIFDI